MSYKGLNILSLMQRWGSKREMMGDDPPYLAVGTEVSAKYKGAFCEAKVRKIVRSVKCKIAYKLGLGTTTVTDDQIKGTLRAGSVVEVKHADKKEYVEATIIKIQDCSQYTVVFDDGDITTLRRTALCLKSGRHFAESETLDQLPLTHPEHFGNPVMGGRRGRRNRADDSSDDEDSIKKAKQPKEEKEADIGKVVCVEISEKKKQKDNWFPGLVVAPTAQDTVKINVKEDYLVRSFKDGRYYTVPKKEATPFTREIGQKVDNNNLRTAVEKALLFLDKDELPPHWDRELLFGLNEITDTDSDGAFDSDTSDDEPREEKDHFVAQLYKFMDDRGTPINKGPTINGRDVDLYKLFKVVHKLGGYNRVTNHNQWKTVSHKLGFGQNPTSINLVKHAYKKFLHSFEDFYRKLGCTMVNHPRGQRSRQRSNRSLIRDKDKTLPSKEKQVEKDGEENKEVSVVEPAKEKDNTTKEEPKLKEVVLESLKPQRETRKESQRPRSDKVEKKDDVKILPSVSKINETPVSKVVREDKIKSDDREERIKLRDIVKLDSNIKEEPKSDKESVNPKVTKEIKNDESQKLLKSTRREIKEIKKEEKEKDTKSLSSEREIRHKKTSTSNPVEIKNNTEEVKKKSRSLFSKITGSKRIKPMNDQSKIPRTSKPLGLNSVRQKRTFSERMKAMVKKFKIKTGVKHLRHKSPTPSNKECEEKKKSTTEDSAKVAVPQLTRSKSREEFSCKLRKLELNSEKKPATHPPTQPLHPDKKQLNTKKRKEDDKAASSSNEEPLDILPNYKTVAIGDKLKVYYGPTHESKVTYEAKVLNLKEEDHEVLFLVHYTGWNTRYDEWIKRGRIADNLSWTPGRAKRTRQHQAQHSTHQKPMVKRSKSGGDMSSSGGGGGGPRSTTPSSVTSSSSRTKSPAVSNAPRIMRSRTRTRLTSGHTHTDFSESEMDDDYESDETEEAQGSNEKEASNDQRLSSDEKDSKDVKEILMEKMKSKTYRPAYRRRMESGGETDDAAMEHKKIKDESEEEGRFEKTRSRSEKRKSEEVCKAGSSIPDDMKKDSSDLLRSDRLRNKRKVVEEKFSNESSDERESKQESWTDECNIQKESLEPKIKSEFDKLDSEDVDVKRKLKRKTDDNEEENKESQSNERRRSKRVTPRKEELKLLAKEEDDQPKGREFDLNQIRSELKGITSANKVIVDVVALSDKEDDVDENVEDDDDDDDDEEEDDNTVSVHENEFKTIPETTLDDIYEFKEPEPFEFEVRSKCGDEKSGKIQRRSFGRVCDESNSTSPVTVRKKIPRTKSESPTSFETKKSTEQTSVKSDDEEVDKDISDTLCDKLTKDLKTELRKSPSLTTQKNEPLSGEIEISTKNLVHNKIEEIIQPLSLFSDLPDEEEERGVDEDSGSRLVISEPETESESQGPLFSHQQRNHEDFFPTSITQSSSVEDSQNKSPFSGFSERSKEEDRDKDSSNKYEEKNKEDGKEEDYVDNDEVETEDDPIISAIQRALSQTTEDEDSNDVDLLSEFPDPTHKQEEIVLSLTKDNDSTSESSQESDESQNEDNTEAQISQSVESDDNDQIEINSCKIIEEVNIESNDCEPEFPEEKEILDIEDETEPSQPVTIELKEEVEIEKEAESQDLINIITIQEEIKEEEEMIEEVCVPENDINNEDENEEEQECIVKEEIVEESQSNESVEIDNGDTKVNVEEVTEQVAMSEEEVVLETVETKQEETQNDKDDCVGKEEECEIEDIVVETNESGIKGVDIKEEANEVEETDANLESLLCEETIPGSPAPSSSVPVENPPSSSPELPFASAASAHPVTYKAPQPPTSLPPPLPPPPLPPPPPPAPLVNEAAPVMENTPPTTPESSLSPISNSPRGERSGSSPVPENESSKSNRDSSEVDMESFPTTTKIGHYSEEDTNSTHKKTSHHEDTETQGIKKRRRSHKRSEDNVKRIKMAHRSPRHAGSDSDDDTSENSLDLLSLHSRSPRPSKYNFFVQLDPDLDSTQRIAVLQQKLADLRKTYMTVKAELAGIDRRRKKLRRREREASVKTSVKSEVPCS